MQLKIKDEIAFEEAISNITDWETRPDWQDIINKNQMPYGLIFTDKYFKYVKPYLSSRHYVKCAPKSLEYINISEIENVDYRLFKLLSPSARKYLIDTRTDVLDLCVEEITNSKEIENDKDRIKLLLNIYEHNKYVHSKIDFFKNPLINKKLRKDTSLNFINFFITSTFDQLRAKIIENHQKPIEVIKHLSQFEIKGIFLELDESFFAKHYKSIIKNNLQYCVPFNYYKIFRPYNIFKDREYISRNLIYKENAFYLLFLQVVWFFRK